MDNNRNQRFPRPHMARGPRPCGFMPFSSSQQGIPNMMPRPQQGIPNMMSGSPQGIPNMMSGPQQVMSNMMARPQQGVPGIMAGHQQNITNMMSGPQQGVPNMMSGPQQGMPNMMERPQVPNMMTGPQKVVSNMVAGPQQGVPNIMQVPKQGIPNMMTGSPQQGVPNMMTGSPQQGVPNMMTRQPQGFTQNGSGQPKPFQNPFIAGRNPFSTQVVLPKGTPPRLNVGFPVIPTSTQQMRFLPQGPPFMTSNVIPWGAGVAALRLPGSFQAASGMWNSQRMQRPHILRGSGQSQTTQKTNSQGVIDPALNIVTAQSPQIHQTVLGAGSSTIWRRDSGSTVCKGDSNSAMRKGDISSTGHKGESSSKMPQEANSSTSGTGDCSSTVQKGENCSAVQKGDSTSASEKEDSSIAVQKGDSSSAMQKGDSSSAVQKGDSSSAVQKGDSSSAVQKGDSHSTVPQGESSSTVQKGDGSSTLQSSSDNDTSGYTSNPVSDSGKERSGLRYLRDRDRLIRTAGSDRNRGHGRDTGRSLKYRENMRERRRHDTLERKKHYPYDSSSDRNKPDRHKRRRIEDRDREKDKERERRDSKRPRHEKRYEDRRREDKESLASTSSSVGAPVEDEKGKEDDTPAWVRCSPADLYFTRDSQTDCLVATKKMMDLEDRFETELIQRARQVIATRPVVDEPPRPPPKEHHHHHHHHSESDSDSSSSCDSDSEDTMEWMEEMNRKKQHPHRLHDELWYNDPGEMNDGPLCRCSIKSRRSGIRHNIFPGEEPIPQCDLRSNNLNHLFHYRLTMSPSTNFLTKSPTVIEYDNHEYIFEGFSLFSHYQLQNIPVCKVIRFNIEYTIHFIEEQTPENFTIRSLDLFSQLLFTEILELVDIDWKGPGSEDDCILFHLMPRFARSLPENGKEILSMNEVLSYLLHSSKPLLEETELALLLKYDQHEWQDMVDEVRGMIVTFPGKKPSSIRIDQLDRQQLKPDVITYPLIIHFGVRPAQLSYAGDPAYQKAWKQYVKYKHLLNSKPKVTSSDKLKLEMKEQALQDLRMKSTMKREVTVELSSEGFIRTGIKSDICQHALLLPVLLGHLRFHKCLGSVEKHLGYEFKDRSLLQLALTHTSYRVNYGTNPDHARNSLANCGMRLVEYGDRKIHYVHTRKRGINILIDIMSRMGHKEETSSEIPHNERLEFLGDAVVEFLSSVHLFFMFPWLEEGGLSTYRTAIVQNQHLSVLGKKLHLQDYMLYAHGPDLCHESDLRHAMANCFEALMGALFLDGGVELADRIFANTLFEEEDLLATWRDLPLHPLQEEEPNGDRHWVESSHILQWDRFRNLAPEAEQLSVTCPSSPDALQ